MSLQLGAICGGLLEYNSMYFGFQFLYLFAMGCYVLAFVSEFALSIKDIDGYARSLRTRSGAKISSLE